MRCTLNACHEDESIHARALKTSLSREVQGVVAATQFAGSPLSDFFAFMAKEQLEVLPSPFKAVTLQMAPLYR